VAVGLGCNWLEASSSTGSLAWFPARQHNRRLRIQRIGIIYSLLPCLRAVCGGSSDAGYSLDQRRVAQIRLQLDQPATRAVSGQSEVMTTKLTNILCVGLGALMVSLLWLAGPLPGLSESIARRAGAVSRRLLRPAIGAASALTAPSKPLSCRRRHAG